MVPGGGLKANMKKDLADYGGIDEEYGREYEDFMWRSFYTHDSECECPLPSSGLCQMLQSKNLHPSPCLKVRMGDSGYNRVNKPTLHPAYLLMHYISWPVISSTLLVAYMYTCAMLQTEWSVLPTHSPTHIRGNTFWSSAGLLVSILPHWIFAYMALISSLSPLGFTWQLLSLVLSSGLCWVSLLMQLSAFSYV